MTLNQLAFSLGMEGNQLWITVLLYAVIFGGLYFVLMRPQQKKKKQEDEMRKSLQIGDEITTIGGIVGKIVSIKNDSDSVIIETSIDRSKLHIKNWAIAGTNNANVNEKTK